MDFRELKEIGVTVYHNMRAAGIRVDGVTLFGSHAKGLATEQSDIDLAILSRDFGHDRLAEGALVNIHVNRVDYRAEAIPVSLSEFFERHPVSPILAEIQKDGIFLV
jgi:hypothetical protein